MDASNHGPMSTSTTPSDEGIDTSNPHASNQSSVFRSGRPSNSMFGRRVPPPIAPPISTAGATVVIKTEGATAAAPTNPRLDMSYSIQIVQAKLSQATQELDRSTSIETSIKLCELIKACTDSLASLYAIHGGQSPSKWHWCSVVCDIYSNLTYVSIAYAWVSWLCVWFHMLQKFFSVTFYSQK